MGFSFKENNLIKIEIEGAVYPVKYDTEFQERCANFALKAAKLKDKIQSQDEIAAQKQVNNLCKQSIDALLGEGSSDKIFKGRQEDMMETMDVMMYIMEEVQTYKDKKMKKYDNFSKIQNRAGRRNKKRHK